jgi:hypothetical protein
VAKKKQQHRRKAIVFASLITVLTGTTALLLALSPAPLAPGNPTVLFNADGASELQAIFQTDRPMVAGKWTSILIHSGPSDPRAANGDHFLICNGDRGIDGEIQVSSRWSAQSSAVAPTGTDRIDAGCVSICVINDENQTPTPMQMHRLDQLVKTLRSRTEIAANRVYTLRPATAALPGR